MDPTESASERTGAGTTVYTADHRHTITFGQVARRSLPARLCRDEPELKDMIEGRGQYAVLRAPAELSNAELYAYLRLGVPAASALALKAMGYPTPESLKHDERASALLPGMLVLPDREYPYAFIDACEADGVSARACEQALRRGISHAHAEGALGPRDLVRVFQTYATKGKAVPPESTLDMLGPADATAVRALCSGVIPLAAVAPDGQLPVHGEKVRCFIGAMRGADDRAFFERLIADPPLLGSFLRALPGWRTSHEHVHKLREVVERFGVEVLDLRHPMLCLTPTAEGGGPAGVENSRYAEDVMAACGRRFPADGWVCAPGGEVVNAARWLEGGGWPPRVTMADMAAFRAAGVGPKEVAARVFDEGITPAALLAAAHSGVSGALLDGAL